MELDHGIKDVHQVVATFLKTLECVICLDLLQDPVSTNCHHQFCRKCILKVLQTKFQAPCPLCKAPMTKRSLREKTQLGEVIGAVKELASAVKNDTGIEVTPPRDPLPSTSSPEGRSRMQLFHIAHPSPIKPTVMKRQLCQSTSTEAREQSRCTRQRRKRQRLINVMIREDEGTTEDTMGHPTLSTNINIQSDFPVTRRKHKTMTRSCARTKGRSKDEEADNDKNTVKAESDVRVSRDAGVTLEQELHPNSEEHCESKNSASRQKSNNDKTSDISQELLKSHLQNSDFVPCDLETHKNTCLKPDSITNVAMSSDKKTKTKQTKIQTFISSNYKDKENILGLTSNVTKYNEDVLVFPAEAEETVTKNIGTVQRNYISTSEEQPTRDISSKIQKTFDLNDRLNNIQVRRNFSFRKDYTRHKNDYTICKKHKKDKHIDSNQKVEEWLVQCLNSFTPVKEQEKKPTDILESVDLKILNDRNASIDNGLTESCAAWKNSDCLNKSNTITTFCCPQRSINLGETKEVHEETSIQSLKKRRLEYFCDVNDLKCQSSTVTANLQEVTENNPTVTENKENNCMSATKKVLWQRKKEIKSPLAERNKDNNIYMNADKQELKVMSMHVNELLCEQPIEKKKVDDGNKDIFNPIRNKDAFCAENDDYNTLDDYYFFCTPAFTLPVDSHEVNQRNRLKVSMEGVDDLAISRIDEIELEQTSKEKFEDITTKDKKLEIKTDTDEENKLENHENSVSLLDHLSGIPCEIQQNTDKSENDVSIIRKKNSPPQEILDTLKQQETKRQKNSTQVHFETTSISDETDNTVPVELYPVTSDETDAFSVVSNPDDKNCFPDETRNLETKVQDKDDFSLQEIAVDENSLSKVDENNHESNFNPSCQKDNARKSEVLQKICSRNTGHDDAFTIRQGTKEQVVLGNLNTSQNFIETTNSLAASRTPPQAAASFRLVSLLNQEESRKVHLKPGAAQVSVISESNLEKKEPEVASQVYLNGTRSELTMSNPPKFFTKIDTSIDSSMMLPGSFLDTEEISLKDIEKCMKKPVRKTFTIHVDTQDWDQLNSKSMNTLEMFNELCSEAVSMNDCKGKDSKEEIAYDFSCSQEKEEMCKEHNVHCETQITNVSTNVKNNKSSCALEVEGSSIDTKKLEPSCNEEISSYNNFKTSHSSPKIVPHCSQSEENKNFSLNKNTELEKISEGKSSCVLKKTSSCEKSNDVVSQFRKNDSVTPPLDLNSQQFVATGFNKSYIKRWEILLETIANGSASKTIKLSDSTVKLEVNIENETLVLSISSASDKEEKDATTQVDNDLCMKANHKSIQTDHSLFTESREKEQFYDNLKNEGTKQVTCVDRNNTKNLNQLIQKDFETPSTKKGIEPSQVLNQSAATFDEHNFRVDFNENVKLNSNKNSVMHIKPGSPSTSRQEIFQPVVTSECTLNGVSGLAIHDEKTDVHEAISQEAKSASNLNKKDHVIHASIVEVAKTDFNSNDMKIFEKNLSNTTTFKKLFTEDTKRDCSSHDKKEKSHLNSEKGDFTLEIISPSVPDYENSNSQSVLFDKLVSAYKISSSDADALFAAELIDPLETLTTRQQSLGTPSSTSQKLKPIKESNDRTGQDVPITENLNNCNLTFCDETRALVNTELSKSTNKSVQEKTINQQKMSFCDDNKTKVCHKILRRKKFYRIRQISNSSDSSDEELLPTKGNLKHTAVISNGDKQLPQLSSEILKEEDWSNKSSTQLCKQDNQLQKLDQYIEKCPEFSAENSNVKERLQWPSNETSITKEQTCKLFQEHSMKDICEECQKPNLLEGISQFTREKSNAIDSPERSAQNPEEQFYFTEQLHNTKVLVLPPDKTENLKEIHSLQCSEELMKNPFTLNTDTDNKDLFEQSVNRLVVCENKVSTNFDKSCRQVESLGNSFSEPDHQTQDISDRQKEPLDSKSVLMKGLKKSQVPSWNSNEIQVLEKSLQQDTYSSDILPHIQVSCQKNVPHRQIPTFISQETCRSGATSNDITSSAWSSQGESLSGDPDLIRKEIEEMKQRILQMEALINGSRPACISKDIVLGDKDLVNNSHQKTSLAVQNLTLEQENSYNDCMLRRKTGTWGFKNDEDSGEESDDLFNTVSPTPPKRPDNRSSLLVSFTSGMKRNKSCHT